MISLSFQHGCCAMLVTLQNTPLWVYVVFLVLVYFGLKARNPQHESRFSLLSTPLVLLGWSLLSLNLTNDPGFTFSGWLIALLLGALSAWLIFPNKGINLDDPETGLIVPGTWKALILLLLFLQRTTTSAIRMTCTQSGLPPRIWCCSKPQHQALSVV
jgi:hypothetical protein